MVLAHLHEAEHHLVLKTASLYDDILPAIKKELLDARDFKGKSIWNNKKTKKRKQEIDIFVTKFLWSPIPNKSPKINQNETLNEINKWHNNIEQSKGIATYELAIYSPQHWSAKPVDGYQNLLAYVREGLNGSIPLRTAMWSIDPMGDKGTLSREYAWKFFGNETHPSKTQDLRGNQHWLQSINGVQWSVINTDMPFVYRHNILNKAENLENSFQE